MKEEGEGTAKEEEKETKDQEEKKEDNDQEEKKDDEGNGIVLEDVDHRTPEEKEYDQMVSDYQTHLDDYYKLDDKYKQIIMNKTFEIVYEDKK